MLDEQGINAIAASIEPRAPRRSPARRRAPRTRQLDQEFESLRLILARHISTGAHFRAGLAASCLLHMRPLNSEIWRARSLLRHEAPTRIFLASIVSRIPGVQRLVRGLGPK
jgi:hypothetical protein